MTMTIDNYQDMIDVRDVIEEFESVEGSDEPEDIEQVLQLQELLSDLAGSGGDHRWRGDWYPVTLIRDSYFVTYSQEFAEEVCEHSPGASWPYDYIDWPRAAEALQMDYTSVEYQGTTYWYR